LNTTIISYHFQAVSLPAIALDSYGFISIYDFFKYDILGWTRSDHFRRILLPFMASLVPLDDSVLSFKVVNIISINLMVIILHKIWGELQIRSYLIIMAFFWLFLHQYGPIRFYNFWPTSVDVPAYLFNTVLLYVVLKNEYKWLLLVAPVAALQHETFFVFTHVLLFYKISSFYFFGNRSSKNKSALIFIGSSCVLMFIAMSLPSLINPQGQGHSFIRIISNLTQILGERYILGTIPLVMVHFFCYAGLLLLALLNFNQSYRNLEWLTVLILFV